MKKVGEESGNTSIRQKNWMKIFADAKSRTWPLLSGLLVLFVAAFVAAMPGLVAVIASITNGLVDPTKLMLGAVAVLLATLTVNLAFRAATMEKVVEELKNSHDRVLQKFSLVLAGLDQMQILKNVDVPKDCSAFWTKAFGDTSLLNPSLWSEVIVDQVHSCGTLLFTVPLEKALLWAKRVATGRVTFILPVGAMIDQNETDNVFQFNGSSHDMMQIQKVVALTDAIQRTGSTDISMMRVVFSKQLAYDTSTVITTTLKDDGGKARRAAVCYDNDYLPGNGCGERDIIVYYESDDLMIADKYHRKNLKVEKYRKDGKEWTAQQLLNCFRDYIPDPETGLAEPIPADFEFDPRYPMDYQDERNETVWVDFDDGSFKEVPKRRPQLSERSVKSKSSDRRKNGSKRS